MWVGVWGGWRVACVCGWLGHDDGIVWCGGCHWLRIIYNTRVVIKNCVVVIFVDELKNACIILLYVSCCIFVVYHLFVFNMALLTRSSMQCIYYHSCVV